MMACSQSRPTASCRIAALVGRKVGAVRGKHLTFSKHGVVGVQRPQIAAHAGLIRDDRGVPGVVLPSSR
jgi:hypothetical protein